ncbi:lysophospholipid acyltransferase family protein [Galactobacter valiniphilus]|uniref:lysophospholipid acyltransferase family protein n=1 Tax=Galactobacter valiniphilus TaxID=2676122 RepID=UPI0037363580
MFYWFAKTFVVGPLACLFFRPWVRGMHHIPAEGAAIIASNHLSVSDSIFLPVMVPRPISFLAKKEYFTGKGLKGALKRRFFLLANQLPMDRAGGEASLKSLEAGEVALREGRLLGIYPEGTRSPDGRMYRGKIGVARLAIETGLPIIPVAMIGTDKVQPIGKVIPHLRRVGIIVGEPIEVAKGDIQNRAALRELTDRVMRDIQRLSGQEYVDRYAADVKAEIAAQAEAAKAAASAKPAAPAQED